MQYGVLCIIFARLRSATRSRTCDASKHSETKSTRKVWSRACAYFAHVEHCLMHTVRLLREELSLLSEPGSHVGEIAKLMGKSKALVKVSSYLGVLTGSSG